MNLGKFREKIKLYAPNESVNAFGETALVSYVQKIVAYAKRRDIEWSTIGEEVHGKQLVVEARTEFYIKKFRPEIKENWVVVYDGTTYEITRVDEFKNGEYTRILALRRDNFAPELLLNNPVFMLDTHSGATMAFSVRRLNTLYTGPAMRVRRESDDQELDIPFTTAGDLNTDILEEFCEGTDGWVKVWRDQSGNGYDAIETIHSRQPQIVDNGVIKRNGDGEICIFFETYNRRFKDIGPELDTAPHSAFVLAERYAGSNDQGQDRRGIYGFGDAVNEPNLQYKRFDLNFWETYLGYTFIGNGVMYTSINSHTQLSDEPRLFSSRYDGSTYKLHVGAIQRREYNITRSSRGKISLAHRNHSDINMSEFVLYTSFKPDSTRESIETNVNDYYGLWEPFDEGLLDTYTGATMAYSLRRLNSSYTGPAIEIQDENNSVFDVPFDLEGNLNEDQLRYKIGSGANDFAKIRTWYDQSGSGNHLVQTDYSLMGTIVDAGVINKDADGRVFVDNTGAAYDIPATVSQPFTAITAVGHSAAYKRIMHGGNFFWSPNNTYQRFAQDKELRGYHRINYAVPHVYGVLANGDNTTLRFDGAEDNTGEVYDADLTSGTRLLTGADGSAYSGSNQVYEFLLYTGNRYDDLTPIERDMAKKYGLSGYTKPLDSAMGSSALAAYGLRKLRSDWAGPAIRVFNTGTSDTEDIGFDDFGNLDVKALMDFTGPHSAQVIRWYDQMGGNRHGEQNSFANTPIIVDQGTLKTSGGRPSIYFKEHTNTGSMLEFKHEGIMGQDLLDIYTIVDDDDDFDGSKKSYILFSDSEAVAGRYSFVIRSNVASYNDIITQNFGQPKLIANNVDANIVHGTSTRVEVAQAVDGRKLQVYEGAKTQNDDGTVEWDSFVLNGYNGADLGSFNFVGHIQEMILFNTDNSANRRDLSNNMAFYYNLGHEKPISINIDYSGGQIGSYSLRKLTDQVNDNYCCDVRREGQSNVHRIGFDQFGNLDVTALEAYANGSAVYIQKWFDQSGGGNHLVQSDHDNQPQICDDSGNVFRQNGLPTSKWVQGSGSVQSKMAPTTTNLIGVDAMTVFIVRNPTDNDYLMFHGGAQAAGPLSYVVADEDGNTSIDSTWRAPNATHKIYYNGTEVPIVSGTTDRKDLFDAMVNDELAVEVNEGVYTGSSSWTDFVFCGYNGRGLDGYLSEVLLYQIDKSSDRTDIEANINDYYKLY
jgi:hypothetical protein